MQADRYLIALPPGYQLGPYRIDSVLGQGGFGITYRADDAGEQRPVAIKEYFPSMSAIREGRERVCPNSKSANAEFSYGLRRFTSETEMLTRFDHPNIVKVWRLIPANNTAYMIMSFEEGESLARLLERFPNGLEEAEIVRLFSGIIDGLELVHRTGHLHRDIAPDNIIIRQDGTPVIIDFGAARYAFGQKSKSIGAIIKRGYSPPEQYAMVGSNQGAWTDIYALGAVAYRCIGGATPPNSLDRQQARAEQRPDPMIPAATVGRGRYSPSLLNAIDKALALNRKDRPASAKQWLSMFVAPAAPPSPEAPKAPEPPRPARLPRSFVLRRLLHGLLPDQPKDGKGATATVVAPPATRRAAGDPDESRCWVLSGTDSTGSPVQITVHEPALRNGRLVIGRDGTVSDIVIADETVSRRHAVLSLAEDRLCIEDVNSLNGTSVDGIPIATVQKPVALPDRARIRLGGAHLVVSAGRRARSDP